MAARGIAFMDGPTAQPTTIEDAMAEQERQSRAQALGKALGGGDGSGKAAPVYSPLQGGAMLAGGAIDGLQARAKVERVDEDFVRSVGRWVAAL